MHTPNKKSSIYETTTAKIKVEIHNWTIIVGDFNTSLSTMTRTR